MIMAFFHTWATPEHLRRALLGWVCVLLLSAGGLAQESERPAEGGVPSVRNVLLLNSYHQSMLWDEDIYRAIKDHLGIEPRKLDLYVENMDTKRHPFVPPMDRILEDFYARKFAKTHFSLIIATDNNAFDLLRACRDRLFPGVPVVFCGVNDFKHSMMDGLHGFTGVAETFDAAGTLDLALSLHPNVKRVLVVNDRTETGIAYDADFHRQLASFTPKVRLDFSGNWTMDRLMREVRALPQDSLVLLGLFYHDGERYFSIRQVAEALSRNSPVPVYGVMDYYVGHGIVGGNVEGGYIQGEAAARMAGLILDGASPESIPVEEVGPTEFMFDHLQLKRWDIPRSALPAESVIINAPVTFYTKNRKLVWMMASIMAGLLTIILMLVTHLVYRRRIERELRMHRENLEDLVVERTAQLREATQRAEEASRAKSVFLATMSHEIRSPMTAILGFTELLKMEETAPGKIRYLDRIALCGRNLVDLINEILDLSRIEAGRMELQILPASIRGIAGEIHSLFELSLQEKGLSFQVTVDPTLPPLLLLDAVRLRQVLINLVNNAARFTHTGSVQLRVFRTDVGKATEPLGAVALALEVEDSGVGIREEEQERIFGTFVQANDQDHARYGGTGLGLAICKGLLDLMQGTLSVTSEIGKGSIFRIHLPQVEVATSAPASEPLQDTLHLHFKPACIVIADDLPYNRDLIQGYLQDQPFRLLTAADGREALELIQREAPDLVLMDIRMPEMDGLEVMGRLKRIPACAGIPIIVVTASSMKDEEASIKAVSSGFIRKPFDRATLFRQLARFLPT